MFIVYFLDMPEPVPCKPFLHAFQECDLVVDERVLVFHGLPCQQKTLLFRDRCIIFPVLFKTGDLAPVHIPLLIRFTVKHVRVDPAYGKPAVIDSAPPVLKEPAGSLPVIFYFEGVTGDVECAVLVAELRVRRGLQCVRIDLPGRRYIPFQQEDMAIERPGAALCTGSAAEPYLPDHTGKMCGRVGKKGVFFCSEGSNAVRYGNKGNDNPSCVCMGWERRYGFYAIFPGYC